ncbi:isopentenyl diphosphate isomerase/L-lactate dehydrogenase-like FMN-dependent dehydrogenase [Salirhabdus euzebyi]|uniref:L-lactate oxidase n=1 Tax=Salirhabdus euzebyi TaxID=394506 RepID=A0A841Q5W5_9BACI|nr:alpha-hydroxy-acid oxidizing protein [Salirhabdus euzebyi]MBB6453753.1 isopentenyl diphosphate isomerase/L-lactate dehydrogenase-like FMN-dependent dehydrogenase [Salirhabdus euzebyi]
MPNNNKPIYHYSDLEKHAKGTLSHEVFTYIQSGSGNEETLKDNEQAFKKWKIKPQFLNDVSERNLSISLLDETYKTPFLLAPVGHLGAAHPDGELAVARAAKEKQVPYIVSTVSTFSLEEIADELGDTPRWFQLYWSSDQELTASLVKRAEKAGYSAIVVTIDTPILGYREADLTNQYFPLRAGYGSANYFADPVFRSRLKESPEVNKASAIEELLKIVFHPKLSWKDLAFIRKHTKLPIILKGVLHPNDAIQAVDYGADGIIVSNHGGRQLDGVLSSLDALPNIVQEVSGKIPVLFDSGIRRGPDVIKAYALGADAVLLGRPYVYGLAINGQAGVEEVLEHFLNDVDVSLATAGKSRISELDSSLVVKV